MSSIQPTLTRNWQPEVPFLETPGWYALQTRARLERKICQQVQDKQQEAYVPVIHERHRWSDRNQVVDVPMFPGYVFVRAMSDPADRLAVLQTNGAYAFVTFKGVTARVRS